MPPIQPPQSQSAQVAAILRHDIHSGRYHPGQQLPSEATLAAEYGLSRPTINKAFLQLAREGLVVIERGRGTFVREQRPIHHVSSSYVTRRDGQERAVWATALSKQGMRGSQRIREIGVVEADADTAAALGLSEGGSVVVRRRIMLMDDDPVQLADSYYPATIAEDTELARPALLRGGTVAALERLGNTPTRLVEQVSTRMPTPDEVRLLDMPPGIPVLRHTRITYNQDDVPVEYDVTIMRGDRHVMEYELPAAL